MRTETYPQEAMGATETAEITTLVPETGLGVLSPQIGSEEEGKSDYGQ